MLLLFPILKRTISNHLFYNMLGANDSANVCITQAVKKRKIILIIIIHSVIEFCFC